MADTFEVSPKGQTKMADTFDKSPSGSRDFENDTHDNMSASQMIANVEETDMTEDELMDLTYAFQAADMDGGGAIDAEEFGMMLSVMGCSISKAQVKQVIVDAKSGFGAWKKMSDDENIAKCQIIWEKFDDDNSGTMDLDEVNSVIAALKKEGFNPSPMSAKDLEDGELDFDEFSAWFLKQEGLPDSFGAPTSGGKGGLSRGGKGGLVKRGMGGLMAPVKLGAKIAMGPIQLMEQSVAMIPGATMIPGIGGTASPKVRFSNNVSSFFICPILNSVPVDHDPLLSTPTGLVHAAFSL